MANTQENKKEIRCVGDNKVDKEYLIPMTWRSGKNEGEESYMRTNSSEGIALIRRVDDTESKNKINMVHG